MCPFSKVDWNLTKLKLTMQCGNRSKNCTYPKRKIFLSGQRLISHFKASKLHR